MALHGLDMPFIVCRAHHGSGKYEARLFSLADLDEKVWGAFQMGKVSAEEILCLEDEVCPGPGACPILGTRTRCSGLVEAVGMAMPGAGTCYGHVG